MRLLEQPFVGSEHAILPGSQVFVVTLPHYQLTGVLIPPPKERIGFKVNGLEDGVDVTGFADGLIGFAVGTGMHSHKQSL